MRSTVIIVGKTFTYWLTSFTQEISSLSSESLPICFDRTGYEIWIRVRIRMSIRRTWIFSLMSRESGRHLTSSRNDRLWFLIILKWWSAFGEIPNNCLDPESWTVDYQTLAYIRFYHSYSTDIVRNIFDISHKTTWISDNVSKRSSVHLFYDIFQ